MPESTQTQAEIFRDTPLPPDATVALHFAEPDRVVRVAREIESIQRGETPLVVFALDQLNATVLLTYLHHAMAQIGPNVESSRVVEKLALDLEGLVRRDCPELARIIANGRAGRGGQS